MTGNADAIVIGGGINGLVAATALAQRGRAVTLLERRAVLGGLAAGDGFHPGFTAAGPMADATMLRPHVVETLGLDLERVEPASVLATQTPGDGPGLLLHRDPALAAAAIERHDAEDVAAYAAYHAFLDRLRPVAARLLDDLPPALAGDAASLWTLATRGLAVRRLGRDDLTELLRVAPMCVADWLGDQFRCELLRFALAAPALVATSGGPWAPGTAGLLLRRELLAGRDVAGGATAVIDALAAAARRQGATLRTEATVERIRTGAGGVEGVTLAGGERIDAPVVVATCDPRRTMLGLLPPAAVSPTLAGRIDALRDRGTTAIIDLAVRGPVRFAGRGDDDIERAHVSGTIDDMERAADAIKYGRCSERPVLAVTVPSIVNPALAPEGHHVVSILAHYAPFDRRGGWTDEAREQFGDAVMAALAPVAPDLPGQVLARRVLAPPDIERVYGVSGGHLHHVEHALDQLVVRPTLGCARSTTPIPGLHLGGSGSHPGGGMTGVPGLLAARVVG